MKRIAENVQRPEALLVLDIIQYDLFCLLVKHASIKSSKRTHKNDVKMVLMYGDIKTRPPYQKVDTDTNLEKEYERSSIHKKGSVAKM